MLKTTGSQWSLLHFSLHKTKTHKARTVYRCILLNHRSISSCHVSPSSLLRQFLGYWNIKTDLGTVQSTSRILSLLTLIDLYEPQCFGWITKQNHAKWRDPFWILASALSPSILAEINPSSTPSYVKTLVRSCETRSLCIRQHYKQFTNVSI